MKHSPVQPRPHHRFAMSWATITSVVGAGNIALCAPVSAQASFTPLGDLPGGAFYSEALGVSADGSTVVGSSIISGSILFSGKYAAFVWTAGSGLQDIYHIDGLGTICRAYATSGDGTTVVGSADYNAGAPPYIVAFRWSKATGVTEFGDLPGGSDRAAARSISVDGAIVAGQGDSDSGPEGFRYTLPESGFLGLGDLPGGEFSSEALAISADGQTIVGSSSSADGVQAFRWFKSSGLQGLGFLPTPVGYTKLSQAYAVSADGAVVVGLSRSNSSVSTNGWEAFRWTGGEDAEGMQPLGDLPGGAFLSVAYATNADGSIIVGRAGVQGGCTPFGCQTAGRAFVWDHQHGLRDLTVVLTALGLNLTGWELAEARGISADGRVIVGTGINPIGDYEAWRADLGRPADPADINGDGAVDVDDLTAVILAWGRCPPMPAACPADATHSGAVDADDLTLVILHWT